MLAKFRRWPPWAQAALVVLVSWMIIFAVSVGATQLTEVQRNLLKLAGITLTAVLAGWAYFSKMIPTFGGRKEQEGPSVPTEQHLIFELMQTGQFELIYMPSSPAVRLIPRSPHEGEEGSPPEDEAPMEGS